jgi:hypothetical protein
VIKRDKAYLGKSGDLTEYLTGLPVKDGIYQVSTPHLVRRLCIARREAGCKFRIGKHAPSSYAQTRMAVGPGKYDVKRNKARELVDLLSWGRSERAVMNRRQRTEEAKRLCDALEALHDTAEAYLQALCLISEYGATVSLCADEKPLTWRATITLENASGKTFIGTGSTLAEAAKALQNAPISGAFCRDTDRRRV